MARWNLPRHPWIGLALSAAAGIAISDCGFAPISLTAIALYFLTALLLTLRPILGGVYCIVAITFFIAHQFQYFQTLARALADALAQPQVVHAQGIVVSEPTTREGRRHTTLANFEMRLESIAFRDGPPQKIRARILVHWIGAPPAYGDRISLIASARNLLPTPNPGQFDYTRYLQRRGIFSEFQMRFTDDEKILAHRKGNPLIAIALVARHAMQRTLTRDLEDSPDAAGLVQSMVLGLKNETPQETLALFQNTGTMHLFVVNGLHIGMFAAIAIFLCKPLGISRRAMPLIVIPLMIFYAIVTGLSAGSVRATLMASIFFASRIFERKSLPLNNLAAAAFFLFVWNTNELFLSGFQFSFGVVLAILLLANPLTAIFHRLTTPDPFLPRSLWNRRQTCTGAVARPIASLTAISTAAWLGSLIFTAHYFHLFSLTAIFVNVLIVPIAFLLLAHGLASLVANLFSSTLSILFNNCNWLIAKLILLLIHTLALIPHGHFYLDRPHFQRAADCSVTIFDFEKSDAIFVRAENQNWMIDCGQASDYEFALRDFLKSRGVNRLDGLIFSQNNSAHLAAEPLLESDFKPRTIAISTLKQRSMIGRKIVDDLHRRGIGLALCERNDRIRLSRLATLRVLYPPNDLVANADADKALVLLLECEHARILFMSDSGFLTEHWLLEHEPDLRADVLVKNQHPSDLSASPEFLAAVRPKIVVSGVSNYAQPGFSRADQDRAMRALHITPLWLNETGAVEISVANRELTVRPFLGDQIFRSSIR